MRVECFIKAYLDRTIFFITRCHDVFSPDMVAADAYGVTYSERIDCPHVLRRDYVALTSGHVFRTANFFIKIIEEEVFHLRDLLRKIAETSCTTPFITHSAIVNCKII